MKYGYSKYISLVALSSALAYAFPLGAQQPANSAAQHHHYKLIDIGTFGGPNSGVNEPLNYVPTINQRGQAVGYAAMHARFSQTSNPTACFGPHVSHAFEWQKNTVTDLGSLGGAKYCSDADSINARGEIEGVSENGQIDPLLGLNEIRAVVWNNGNLEDLGTLGGNHSWSFGVDNRGRVVGMSLNGVADPYSIYDFVIFGFSGGTQTRAFLWDHGIMQDLGTLGGPDAWAWSINERGQIFGMSYTNAIVNASSGFPTLDAFFIDKGKMQDVGSLGGVVSFPGALNRQGQAIGGSSVAAGPAACYVASHQSLEFGDPNCHPFLWDHGTLTDLNTSSAGGSPQSSDGMNDNGNVVGAAVFSGQPYDAYLWNNGTATDLGHLKGDCYSEAWAVNFENQVVGDSFGCGRVFQDSAFLWEQGSIVDLNTLIPRNSGLKLVLGNTINDRGEIAGVGVPPGISSGRVFTKGHAFVLIPCDDNHPGIKGCDYSPVKAEPRSFRPGDSTRNAQAHAANTTAAAQQSLPLPRTSVRHVHVGSDVRRGNAG